MGGGSCNMLSSSERPSIGGVSDVWEKWIYGAGGAIVDDGIAMERGKRRMEDEKVVRG